MLEISEIKKRICILVVDVIRAVETGVYPELILSAVNPTMLQRNQPPLPAQQQLTEK